MILRELANCYDLMLSSDKFQVADFNSSIKHVAFKFIIGEDGLIKQVLDLQDKKKGILIKVPLQVTRTSGVFPFFLCDNSKYLLGYTYNKDKKIFQDSITEFEESKKYHETILSNLKDSKYYKAIMNYFENRDLNIKIVNEQDEECFKGGAIVFSLENDKQYIHDIYDIKQQFVQYNMEKKSKVKQEEEGICLVSGNQIDELCSKYEVVKVSGGQPAGSYICFNGSDSYDEKVNISYSSMFKYTTALNTLLLSKNNNYYLSGNTVVFWSDKIGNNEEKLFSAFLESDFKEKDEVENEKNVSEIEYNQAGVDEIESAIKLIKKGMTVDVDKINCDESVNMYILGLSPSNARIFIRFWFKNSIKDFIKLSNRHFEDTKLRKKVKMAKNNYVYEDVGVKLSLIIKTITPHGKVQNVPNTLINTLFKSILTGTNYPISIYNNILLRIRAEVSEDIAVNHTRVSFIKGYLKRFYRLNNLKDKEEEITVALNVNSKDVAYNLGRVFAIIEKIQSDANKSSNIREKYLSSASTTPGSIFPTLLNLSQHHISKINKENNKNFNYYDKMVGQILLNINEFPAIFSIEEQGMFILGYYHQREDIYTSKQIKEEN